MNDDIELAARIFDVQREEVEEAIEEVANVHRAPLEYYAIGLRYAGPPARCIARWDLRRTLEELGKLYDLGCYELNGHAVIRFPKPDRCWSSLGGCELHKRIMTGEIK